MKYRAGANTARDLFPCDVAQPLWIVIDCGQFERIVSLGCKLLELNNYSYCSTTLLSGFSPVSEINL